MIFSRSRHTAASTTMCLEAEPSAHSHTYCWKYEFVSDRYVGVNIEHNFGNGIFRLIPALKFRQFWTAKVLWGSLSSANYALNFKDATNFQTLNGRTYMELGTGVDNILHVFRLDFIWRVLPATLDKKGDHPFGVFGSFRLSF
jgi:hypothetical protein